MLTTEVLEVLKRVTSRAVDELTILESMLELAGSPRHLTEEDFLHLSEGIEEAKKLYWLINSHLKLHEATLEMLPDLNFRNILTPAGVGGIRKSTFDTADLLTVLELMLELAGRPCYLTEEDFLRLREGIEELGTRLTTVLSVMVVPTRELSPPRNNYWSEKSAG